MRIPSASPTAKRKKGPCSDRRPIVPAVLSLCCWSHLLGGEYCFIHLAHSPLSLKVNILEKITKLFFFDSG